METYQHIGELLKNAREERRISLSQAAQQLHIRPRYLEALENGDLSALPGQAYAIGYLKRYVHLLTLDSVEVMRRFEIAQKAPRQPFFFLPQHFSEDKQASLAVVWATSFFAFVVAALWSALQHDAHGINRVMPLPSLTKVNLTQPVKNPCLSGYEKLYPPCYVDTTQTQIAPSPYRPR